MHSQQFSIIAQLLYMIDTTLVKISVGLLLLRFATSIYRYIIYASMIFISLWKTACIFIVIFWCRPVGHAWYIILGQQGSCLSEEIAKNLTSAFSIIDIFFNLDFGLFIPVPMLWHLKISKGAKTGVYLILGLSTVLVLSSLMTL